MNVLQELEAYRSKGELSYYAKRDGYTWKQVEDSGGSRLAAMSWAKNHGAPWPLEEVVVKPAVKSSAEIRREAFESIKEQMAGEGRLTVSKQESVDLDASHYEPNEDWGA